MRTSKMLIIATIVAILGIATIGVALAHRYSTLPINGGMMGYSTPIEDDKWWTEMEEHMRYRFGDAVDEEWFNEMRQYMEEHFEEVRNEEWYDEMRQFMEDRWESRDYEYRYGSYHGGYGRGCWGW